MILKKLVSTSIFFMFSLLAFSACERSEDQILDQLFETHGIRVEGPAARTFVIWVNGDADHYVGMTSTDSSGGLKRADAVEVKRMKEYATQCLECNVVLLHVQRGGDRWYTTEEAWATFLRVYVRGKKVLERKVPLVNSANVALITRLLQFTAHFFSDSGLHFVYRGHPFFPGYDPNDTSDGIKPAPFAYGFLKSPYGLPQFVEGVHSARLSQKLESITLAACTMSHVQSARALAPYAKYLVASQVDVLETLSVSFDLGFLADPALDTLPEGKPVAETIANSLMRRFEETPHIQEALMEYPVTLIDLDAFVTWDGSMRSLFDQIRSNQPSLLSTNASELKKAAGLVKTLSNRYVTHMRLEGKSEQVVESMLRFVRVPVLSPGSLDAGLALEFFGSRGMDSSVTLDLMRRAVEVKRNPTASKKSGLSFLLTDY